MLPCFGQRFRRIGQPYTHTSTNTHIHLLALECWTLMWLFLFRSFFGHIHKIYFHSTIYTRTSQNFIHLTYFSLCLHVHSSQQSPGKLILVSFLHFFCFSFCLLLSLPLDTTKMRRDCSDKKEQYIYIKKYFALAILCAWKKTNDGSPSHIAINLHRSTSSAVQRRTLKKTGAKHKNDQQQRR